MTSTDKRFFHVDDGDADYYLVARDADHAKQVLLDAGVEFTADDGYSYPVDAPEVATAEWREISALDAALKKVWLGEDGTPPQTVLYECAVGDWYTTEF